MNSAKEIENKIKEIKPILKEKYAVNQIGYFGYFGSFAKGNFTDIKPSEIFMKFKLD